MGIWSTAALISSSFLIAVLVGAEAAPLNAPQIGIAEVSETDTPASGEITARSSSVTNVGAVATGAVEMRDRPAPAAVPKRPERVDGYFEPTFTPQVPVTFTPTPFLTPVPWVDGPLVIGYTTENRPLEVYRFGTGPVRRMLIAGIHGGYEWNTVSLADEIIAYLQNHPEEVPSTTTLYILRNLNPDGLARAYGIEGRLNANRVDLNRNWPANWQAQWPNDGCWVHLPVSSGHEPASEPETRSLLQFITRNRVSALINYHSAALGIFPGGIPPDIDSIKLAEAIAAVSTYAYPPIDTGCEFTGTLPDWAADQGIAAVDLELHTHHTTDFAENLEILRMFLSWQP